tara:strand:+ start:4246 stop:4968 length:723 start_codon:yes stop_codon:yes gene_type:complete
MFSKYLERRKRREVEKEFAFGVDKSKLHRVFVRDGVEEIDGVKRTLDAQDSELYRKFSGGTFSARGFATYLYFQGRRLTKTEDNFHEYLRTENIEQKLPTKLVEALRSDNLRDSILPGKDFETDNFTAIFRYGNDTKIRLDGSRMKRWFNTTEGAQRHLNMHLLSLARGMAFKRGMNLEWKGPFNGWPRSEVEIAAEILSHAGSWGDIADVAMFDLADLDAELYQACFAFDDEVFLQSYR